MLFSSFWNLSFARKTFVESFSFAENEGTWAQFVMFAFRYFCDWYLCIWILLNSHVSPDLRFSVVLHSW